MHLSSCLHLPATHSTISICKAFWLPSTKLSTTSFQADCSVEFSGLKLLLVAASGWSSRPHFLACTGWGTSRRQGMARLSESTSGSWCRSSSHWCFEMNGYPYRNVYQITTTYQISFGFLWDLDLSILFVPTIWTTNNSSHHQAQNRQAKRLSWRILRRRASRADGVELGSEWGNFYCPSYRW